MHSVVMTAHMGPHHWARARATAALDSSVLFLEESAAQRRYPWVAKDTASAQVNHRCLFDRPCEDIPDNERIAQICKALDQAAPKVVFIAGYQPAYLRQTADWARSHGATAVLFIDSWEGDHRRFWLKEQVKRYLVKRRYSAAFVAGERAAQYAVKLGIDPNRIWRGVDAVDNDYFTAQADLARRQLGLRESLGLPQEYFLCVARHVREKNLTLLLRAYADYRRQGGPFSLVIAGDGPLRPQLEAQVAAAGLGQAVQLRPWASYEQLPQLYALAKCLVLPSCSEPWGMVVNEAMAAALPVLVSDRCGCMPELCRHGVNGFAFDHREQRQLAHLMGRLSGGEVDLAAMGRMSQTIIASWAPQAWARSLLDCAATCAK